MENYFRLNEYKVKEYGNAGAHDPSMMWDPVTGKYYSYCTDVYGSPLGLEDKIGIPVRSSEDLVHFKYEGTVLSDSAIAEARDNGDFPETANFWAPFTEYVKGEYRMYYSATKAFGSSESRIWLACAENPLGPFENRGVVVDTWGTDDSCPNGIDPHIIWKDEKAYLVYGSFFGGIYIKELNPDTGLSLDGNPHSLGKCISKKSNPPVIDGPEGASVIYVKETGYYYLFQSYGWLGNDYDIRVGRSRCVTGPYVDMDGFDLREKALGQKIANSYRFDGENPGHGNADAGWEFDGFRGPGHGVPFYDPVSTNYFFVHHIRDGAKCNEYVEDMEGRISYSRHYMMVRPMFFIDGWAVLGPENYAGEEFGNVDSADISGTWEYILLDDNDNCLKKSKIVVIKDFQDLPGKYKIYKCSDYENGGETLAVTGYTDDKVCYWMKKK